MVIALLAVDTQRLERVAVAQFGVQSLTVALFAVTLSGIAVWRKSLVLALFGSITAMLPPLATPFLEKSGKRFHSTVLVLFACGFHARTSFRTSFPEFAATPSAMNAVLWRAKFWADLGYETGSSLTWVDGCKTQYQANLE